MDHDKPELFKPSKSPNQLDPVQPVRNPPVELIPVDPLIKQGDGAQPTVENGIEKQQFVVRQNRLA
ncbi:MAG: hypothetical protein AAGJ46_21225 [Planctomycetota bacterium]